MKLYSLSMKSRQIKNTMLFLNFPLHFIKVVNQWVPPITNEEKAIFHRAKNPVFENADAKLFVVKNGKQIVGRIAALINWIEVAKNKPKLKCVLGGIDTVDDLEASRMLTDAVHSWGKQMD